MTDEPDNLVLRQLRSMDIKLDIIRHEILALKGHSIATDQSVLALRKDMQNLETRLARIEIRLQLVDAAVP